MASLSGFAQRPLLAAAAVTIASISSDFHGKRPPSKSNPSNPCLSASQSYFRHSNETLQSLRIPIPNIKFEFLKHSREAASLSQCYSVASSTVLLKLRDYAESTKALKPMTPTYAAPPPSEVLYKWHLPKPTAYNYMGTSDYLRRRSRTVVVLLGWLGAKQKHLRRYADWYTERGFHAITFTFPMSDILSYQVNQKAERNAEMLAEHLADWLEDDGNNLVFHTFSNTGWLTYGVILEKFQRQNSLLMEQIRGCIVDSAPVAAPDPQVFASGFSAAFLKKGGVASSGHQILDVLGNGAPDGYGVRLDEKPSATEAALLRFLEVFFGVVLKLPSVNRRLCDVVGVLSAAQPACPQLYMYSSADKVIPVEHVESFIKAQQKAGHVVMACDFVSTPHVDHFRSNPQLYTSQISQFLEEHVCASMIRK